MSNKSNEIDIKNCIYFFDGMINIMINITPNKINETKILLFIRLDTCQSKPFAAKKISLNPLYCIINKINGYIEESNGKKYLILVFTDKSKDAKKKHEKLWNKIRNFIRSATKDSGNYGEKYMNIRFNVDGNLLLKKTTQLHDANK